MSMADLEQGLNAQNSKEIKPQIKTLVLELLPEPALELSKYQKWTDTFIRITGIETRGIERVPIDERHPAGPDTYMRIFLLWLSSSLTANNIIVGLYGPSLFGLNWNEAAVCATFGGILGSMVVGCMSTWGPRSGNRTLVVTRYFLGYYLSKVCCLLNIFTMLGYGMVNVILGGQVIYAISGGRTAAPVGIVVVAVLTWFIATFGMNLFHFYTRYAWILQLSTLFIMIGCAGPNFNTSNTPSSTLKETPVTLAKASSRLSFFTLCLSSAITWAPSSADYFVYFPSTTRPKPMFLAASTGMGLAMTMTTLLGIGLATGSPTTPPWTAALLTSQGNLLATSFAPLHGFGDFCAIVLVLGMVSNNIPCTYSAALNMQMLGRYAARVPRPLLTTIEVVLYTACGIVAHGYLREIMENFLPLMSCWIVIWLAICVEEACLFRGVLVGDYDWAVWDDASKLPVGMAAGVSFVVGCLGAVLGMSQSYFVGPIARLAPGECDLGIWLAFGFTALVYPGLRLVEIKVIGR